MSRRRQGEGVAQQGRSTASRGDRVRDEPKPLALPMVYLLGDEPRPRSRVCAGR